MELKLENELEVTDKELKSNNMIVLFQDPDYERSVAANIAAERDNIQKAVDAFPKEDCGELAPDEMIHFIESPDVWLQVRWQSRQQVPKGWPKNVDREKYLDILTKPDFSAVIKAAKAVRMYHRDLFVLEADGTVTINQVAAEALIQARTITVDPESDEGVLYKKLLDLVAILKELRLLSHNHTRAMEPIDLNAFGLGFTPFTEMDNMYQFINPHKLKEFLRKQTRK
jgi:hypothetical protein